MPTKALERFSDAFSAEASSQMTLVYNRLYWPILVLFIFKEKSTPMYNGLTMADFKHTLFYSTHTNDYIKDLLRGKWPLLCKEEPLYDKVRYRLTPYGKKVATTLWNHLAFISKQEGKPIEDYVEKIRRTLTLEPDPTSTDVEEEMIKKLEEENAKKAGIVQTPNGPMIDLNKIQVN